MSGSGTGIVSPYNTHRGMDFDGAADWYNSGDPIGIADSQFGFGSVWFRVDGGDGTLRYFWRNQGTRFGFSLNANNQLDLWGRSAGGATLIRMTTTPTYLAGSGWHHAIFSFNCSAAPFGILIVDGAAPALAVNVAATGNVDYTRGTWGWGGIYAAAPNPGANWWNGGLSEVMFHTLYVAIANPVWLQRWRHPNGQPPNLGADGSVALTTVPLIYLAEVGGALVNLGDGGAIAVRGAPVVSADSPKDRWVASLNHVTMGRLQSMG